MKTKNFLTDFALDWPSKLARCLLSICLGLSGCGSLIAFGQEGFPVLHTILVEDRSAALPSYRLADDNDLRQAAILRRGERLPVTPNMALQKGDQVQTGPSLAFAIGFPNGSQLYLRPNTDVIIGSVFAFVGELFVRVKGAFQVDTDFVTAGAEGTAWVMKILPSGDTRCTVLEGRVRVSSQQHSWRPLVVTPNRVTLTRQSKSAETLLASRRELEAMFYWIRQIDRFVLQSRPQTGDSRQSVPWSTDGGPSSRRPRWESIEQRPRRPGRDPLRDSKPRDVRDSTTVGPSPGRLHWESTDQRESRDQRPRRPDRDPPRNPMPRNPHRY